MAGALERELTLEGLAGRALITVSQEHEPAEPVKTDGVEARAAGTLLILRGRAWSS